MDKLISSGAFAGAMLAITPQFFENPSWQNYILFALGGGLFGLIFSSIVNKIKKNKKH